MSNRFSTPGQFPAFLPRLSLTLVLMASLATGLSPTIARAEDGTITELFKSPLSDLPGKEAMVIEVEYGPSGETPIHRHDAHAFVYVLEGHVEMQVRGQPLRVIGPGEVYEERPEDVHLVSRNASATEPARFVVVLLKEAGSPVLTSVH